MLIFQNDLISQDFNVKGLQTRLHTKNKLLPVKMFKTFAHHPFIAQLAVFKLAGD